MKPHNFHALVSGVISLIGTALLVPSVVSTTWLYTAEESYGYFQRCNLTTGECRDARKFKKRARERLTSNSLFTLFGLRLLEDENVLCFKEISRAFTVS